MFFWVALPLMIMLVIFFQLLLLFLLLSLLSFFIVNVNLMYDLINMSIVRYIILNIVTGAAILLILDTFGVFLCVCRSLALSFFNQTSACSLLLVIFYVLLNLCGYSSSYNLLVCSVSSVCSVWDLQVIIPNVLPALVFSKCTYVLSLREREHITKLREYALRVIPAVTRLTVYRRLRVITKTNKILSFF